jgi:DNA-binding MarR family transcriptional regulator
MHIDVPPQADPDAVDELIDALSALVRTWKHAGRIVPAGGQSSLATLQLAAMLDDGELRMGEVAERRGVDQSVVSRQIGELQARGLVCRRTDPSDGRASLVRLTPEGHELIAETRRTHRRFVQDALAAAATPQEARMVADLVTRLTATLATHLDELAGAHA